MKTVIESVNMSWTGSCSLEKELDPQFSYQQGSYVFA
jgi:hypothetical protein